MLLLSFPCTFCETSCLRTLQIGVAGCGLANTASIEAPPPLSLQSKVEARGTKGQKVQTGGREDGESSQQRMRGKDLEIEEQTEVPDDWSDQIQY